MGSGALCVIWSYPKAQVQNMLKLEIYAREMSDNNVHPTLKMIEQVYSNTVRYSRNDSYLPGIVVGLGPLNP